MNSCLMLIKGKIQILVFSLNLITFIIITIITNNKKEKYIEYTSLSKFISNLYIFTSLLIILIHSVFPKFICSFISENLSIFTNDIGKLIINLSIGILYYSSNNTAHLVFAIINFVSSFALFLSEFIFQCTILKYTHFENENNIGKNNNDFNDENNINKNNFDPTQKLKDDKKEENDEYGFEFV